MVETFKIKSNICSTKIPKYILKQTIIGIGVNVNQAKFENKNAISLKNILEK